MPWDYHQLVAFLQAAANISVTTNQTKLNMLDREHSPITYSALMYELTDAMLSISGKYASDDFSVEQATCNGDVEYMASYEYEYQSGEMLLNPALEEYYQIRLLEQ